MENYSQKDDRWGDKVLGTSGLTMRHFGCTTTAVSQALTLAGYPVDPGTLVDNLNANKGFTDESYPYGGAGLIKWNVVEQLYPQFHFHYDNTPGTYTFQTGRWGRFLHFVLKVNGTVYDPYYGTNQEPAGFVEVAGSRFADIDPATAPVAEQPATDQKHIFSINLQPDSAWAAAGQNPDSVQNRTEVGNLQDALIRLNYLHESDLDYTDASGALQTGAGKGYYGGRTEAAVLQLQKDHGIMPGDAVTGTDNPAYYGAGYFGPKTQAVINTL